MQSKPVTHPGDMKRALGSGEIKNSYSLEKIAAMESVIFFSFTKQMKCRAKIKVKATHADRQEKSDK